ncbi:MAG: Rne/Rng family ribonuclease [Clostridium sp.]
MKEIFIEGRGNGVRVAIKNKGKLEECLVEEKTELPQIGEIYKGRVKNILPSINSVFVDIGLEKEGYLYYSNELKNQGIKKGDEILVEIIKEPLGDKGAKLTTKVNIPSKYVVLEIGGSGIEFSKRFKDDVKKELILAEVEEIDKCKLIIRTEGANADINELKREKDALLKEYNDILRKMQFSTKIGKLYGDNLTLNKVLRDKIGNEEAKIIIDNDEDFLFAKNVLRGNLEIEFVLYKDKRGLFEFYGLEKELLKLRHNKVALPCGGNIVIDKTEAMYVIDVNSGKNIKERSFEKTILNTNIEAAREIGRQILLRNLSGIIVIDFIDLREKSGKNIVMKELKDALRNDGGNVKIFPFTELDLVQIARKRVGKSIYDVMEEECNVCKSQGRILRLSYVEKLIKDEIIKYNNENSIESFFIQLDEIYREMVKGDLFNFLTNINGLNKEIYLNFMQGIEGYKIEPLIFNSQKESIEEFKIIIE